MSDDGMTPVGSDKCLVGWRGWHLYQPGFLTSNNSLVWVPGERAEAICNGCRVHETSAPAIHCSCGLYAFKRAEFMKEQGYLNQPIYGEVWLWGRVVEHEKGFRAEYAYPKKFYATEEMLRNQLVAYVAFRYQVPLEEIGEDHQILSDTPEVKAEKERQAKLVALQQAERARRMQMSKIQKAAETKAKNAKLEALAKKMPSKKPGFATLWDEIQAELRSRGL